MRPFLSLLVVLVASTCLVAQKRKTPGERVIVSDERYVISYRATPKDIVFTMDDLRTAEAGSEWQVKLQDSWFQIYVDVNRNGKIDKMVDFSYGVYRNNLSICSQYLIDERASTGCNGHTTTAFYEKSSRGTEHARYRHIVHRFTIPRSELAAVLKKGRKQEVHVVLHCVTQGDAFWAPNSFYPLGDNGASRSFSKTLKLRI